MSPANEKEKKEARRATEGFLFYSRLMMMMMMMIIPTIRENRTWNLVLLIVVMLTHIIYNIII
jgi:hypothetical protein